MVISGLSEDFIFQDAVDFLESKEALPADVYKKLSQEARNRAFTVSGYTSGEMLNRFLQELADAVETGQTKQVFQDNMNTFLEKNGYEVINPWHADVIFRTNVQTAFQAGRYQNMMEARKLRPYWQYKTAGDGQVRESHLAMADRVYAADDPIWNVWYPPNGFRCRCTVVSLSKSQVAKRGLHIEKNPPTLITNNRQLAFPDKGFSNNPAKTPWKPNMDDFDKNVRKAVNKRIGSKQTTGAKKDF